MKFVALMSGGKDSMFSIQKLLEEGHELKALIHLTPSENQKDEIDSYMYQSVGTEIAKIYEELIGLPVFIFETNCKSKNKELDYKFTEGDEVEDLFHAIKTVSEKIDFEGVVSGAILSNYQKNRVENICKRLNKVSLTPIWGKDQAVLFKEIKNVINAVLVKIACYGIRKECVGMNLDDFEKYMRRENVKYLNECGEGGEYETITLDAPFFKKKLSILEFDILPHPDEVNKEGIVYFMKIKKFTTIKKD